MFDAPSFLSTLTTRPGVYCMRDKQGKVLYVGKAKNLKNRLTSYFRPQEDPRIAQLVSKIAHIEVTITPSENEALLLENSLIKSLKPRYNVIFRDDKSYPYLFLSAHTFPRLVYFRGKQKEPGQYFGPYPSAAAVKETLNVLQKLFKLRQCDDLFFKLRSRPCLQYQIQRCTAPCVGYINPEDYAIDVNNAMLFLQGKERSVIDDLVANMQQASEQQSFEVAARLRDQITRLRTVHDQQMIYRQKGNADVLAAATLKGHFCIQLLYIRQGRILDSQSFFPKQAADASLSELLRAFIIQFYLNQEAKLDYPNEIIINETIEDQDLIATSLSELAKSSVKIVHAKRGEKADWLQMAHQNALQTLGSKVVNAGAMSQRWVELKKALGLTATNIRIECFDVSHLFSEATVASCVVFDESGPLKEEYRSYNLSVPAHDDYAAMEQVLTRRYTKRKAEELPLPNVILVDGGKGQLHKAKKVILECQMVDILLLGIAKGEGRKPGLETIYATSAQGEEEWIIDLPPHSSALHLLQHIRDEAHRFAVKSHRRKRTSTRKHSPLESIPGVGVKRRQQLLNYFGGQQALLAASQAAIAQVPGISKALAEKIYLALHGPI
jgi:excinuclease ABC subunit C